MTYQEWESKTEVLETWTWGGENMRDIYKTTSGVTLYDETIVPRHWGKKQSHSTVVDIIYPEAQAERIKSVYNADMDMGRYTDEGYGYPVFRGNDSLEQAYNFILKEKSLSGQ